MIDIVDYDCLAFVWVMQLSGQVWIVEFRFHLGCHATVLFGGIRGAFLNLDTYPRSCTALLVWLHYVPVLPKSGTCLLQPSTLCCNGLVEGRQVLVKGGACSVVGAIELFQLVQSLRAIVRDLGLTTIPHGFDLPSLRALRRRFLETIGMVVLLRTLTSLLS